MREDGDPYYEITIGSLDMPDRINPATQVGIESRVGWFSALHSLPASRTDQDRSPAELAKLTSRQHPDQDD